MRHPLARLRLFTLALPLLIGGCSNVMEVSVYNATKTTVTAQVRVDRVGSKGTLLASADLKPGDRTTLSSDSAPLLEYVELTIGRTGDLGDVPTTQRVPRGKSSWTIATDAESWSGFAIVEGIDGVPSHVVSDE